MRTGTTSEPGVDRVPIRTALPRESDVAHDLGKGGVFPGVAGGLGGVQLAAAGVVSLILVG